eukprot:gene4811-9596_t
MKFKDVSLLCKVIFAVCVAELLLWITYIKLTSPRSNLIIQDIQISLEFKPTFYNISDGIGGLCSNVHLSQCPVSTFNYSNGIKLLVFPKVTPRKYFLRIAAAGYVHEIDEENIFINIIKNAPKNAIFVDIGAALGYYVILARRLCPSLFVFTLNPHPAHRYLMNENLKFNHISMEDIYQLPYAITSTDNDTTDMHGVGLGGGVRTSTSTNNANILLEDTDNDTSTTSSSSSSQMDNELEFNQPASHNPRPIGIKLSTLFDDYLSFEMKQIHLVMIDIQGNEIHACKQLNLAIVKRVSNFFIGTHTLEAHNVCLAALNFLGMSIWELCGEAVSHSPQCLHRQHARQPDGLLLATWDTSSSNSVGIHNMFQGFFGWKMEFIDGRDSLQASRRYKAVYNIIEQLELFNGNWSQVIFENSVRNDAMSSNGTNMLKNKHRHRNHNSKYNTYNNNDISSNSTTSISSRRHNGGGGGGTLLNRTYESMITISNKALRKARMAPLPRSYDDINTDADTGHISSDIKAYAMRTSPPWNCRRVHKPDHIPFCTILALTIIITLPFITLASGYYSSVIKRLVSFGGGSTLWRDIGGLRVGSDLARN